jgi:hypothetical protein
MKHFDSKICAVSRRLYPAVSGIAGAAGLLFICYQPTYAQVVPTATLSLSPPAAVVSVGSIETFDVYLTGATDVGIYDINIYLTPSLLEFVGAAPFTSTDASLPAQLVDQLNTPGDLEISYGEEPSATTGVDSITPTELGSFQVEDLTDLPTTGSQITFGAPGDPSGTVSDPTDRGSEVDDYFTGDNELLSSTSATLTNNASPAPEPSQIGMLALMGLGLGGLLVRAHRKSRGGVKS